MNGLVFRLRVCAIVLLLVVDIFVQAALKIPVYLVTGRARPSARETISATAGQMAARGSPFGRWLAEQIDDVFGAGHCNAAYLSENAKGEVIDV